MKHIVAVGECMVELSGDGQGGYRRSFAGDVYNTAVYLVRHGGNRLRVSFLTALGDDPLSEAMLRTWQGERLDTGLVRRIPGGKPGLYMISTDERGERSFSYWRGESAARRTMALADPAEVTADLLFFTGITLAIFDDSGRKKLLALAENIRAAGGRVAFDPNYRPALWPQAEAHDWIERAYRVTDIALPGLEDHRILFGHGTADEVIAALQAAGCREIVVKNGEQGAWCAGSGSVQRVPSLRAARVTDTTAAGDAFDGAYLAARLLGAAPEEAAHAGAATAAFVVGYPGAITPRREHANFLRRNWSGKERPESAG